MGQRSQRNDDIASFHESSTAEVKSDRDLTTSFGPLRAKARISKL
jgi:hypothetical protein